jgi:hypothetical protein
LMGMSMCRYSTAHIARWRSSMTFIKATKCHHRASTHSNIIKGTCLPLFQGYISSSNCWKRARVVLIAIGVTHQTDEKHLHNMSVYFVGVVNSI